MFGMTALIIMMLSLFLLKHELAGTSELMTIIYEYEHGKLIPMNTRNASLLEKEIRLLTKFIKPFFWLLSTVVLLILPGMNMLAYFIGSIQFYMISVLFWSVCSVAFISQLSGIICIGAVGWVLPVHYLIFKFKEITVKYSRIFEYNEMQIITNHNTISVKTKAMNDFFR